MFLLLPEANLMCDISLKFCFQVSVLNVVQRQNDAACGEQEEQENATNAEKTMSPCTSDICHFYYTDIGFKDWKFSTGIVKINSKGVKYQRWVLVRRAVWRISISLLKDLKSLCEMALSSIIRLSTVLK